MRTPTTSSPAGFRSNAWFHSGIIWWQTGQLLRKKISTVGPLYLTSRTSPSTPVASNGGIVSPGFMSTGVGEPAGVSASAQGGAHKVSVSTGSETKRQPRHPHRSSLQRYDIRPIETAPVSAIVVERHVGSVAGAARAAGRRGQLGRATGWRPRRSLELLDGRRCTATASRASRRLQVEPGVLLHLAVRLFVQVPPDACGMSRALLPCARKSAADVRSQKGAPGISAASLRMRAASLGSFRKKNLKKPQSWRICQEDGFARAPCFEQRDGRVRLPRPVGLAARPGTRRRSGRPSRSGDRAWW